MFFRVQVAKKVYVEFFGMFNKIYDDIVWRTTRQDKSHANGHWICAWLETSQQSWFRYSLPIMEMVTV